MTTRRRGNNEGSITKRKNGNWRAQVSLNGQRLSFSAATKAECQQWIRRTLHPVEDLVAQRNSTITLSEFLQEWLNTSRIGLRPSTIRNYERIIRLQINPLLGSDEAHRPQPGAD
jgi:integrase